MNDGTARLLAKSLQMRWNAEAGLIALLKNDQTPGSPGDRAVSAVMRSLAETYVHEQRVINRIIHEDVDE